MSLESGVYFISSVSFVTGQPVNRFLGLGRDQTEDAIVVLPLGSPPPLWSIVRLPNGNYIVSLDGRSTTPVAGSVRLQRDRRVPFEWIIIRGAPSPPPIGRDSFGIIVPNGPPQQSWFIPSTEGDQAVEVPVKIEGSASSIVIKLGPRE